MAASNNDQQTIHEPDMLGEPQMPTMRLPNKRDVDGPQFTTRLYELCADNALMEEALKGLGDIANTAANTLSEDDIPSVIRKIIAKHEECGYCRFEEPLEDDGSPRKPDPEFQKFVSGGETMPTFKYFSPEMKGTSENEARCIENWDTEVLTEGEVHNTTASERRWIHAAASMSFETLLPDFTRPELVDGRVGGSKSAFENWFMMSHPPHTAVCEDAVERIEVMCRDSPKLVYLLKIILKNTFPADGPAENFKRKKTLILFECPATLWFVEIALTTLGVKPLTLKPSDSQAERVRNVDLFREPTSNTSLSNLILLAMSGTTRRNSTYDERFNVYASDENLDPWLMLQMPEASHHAFNLHENCSTVVFFDVPYSAFNYVHGVRSVARTGQTAVSEIYELRLHHSQDELVGFKLRDELTEEFRVWQNKRHFAFWQIRRWLS